MSANDNLAGAKLVALDALLASHFSAQELVPSPSRNKVFREWYRSEVGLPAGSPLGNELFRRYDRLSSEAVAVGETLLAMLDQYIGQAIEQRTLALQNAKLVRVRIGEILGLLPQQLKHPLVIARMSFWDNEIAKLDYNPDTRAITRENADRAASPPKRLSVFRERITSGRDGKETSTSKLRTILAEHLRTNSLVRNSLGRLSIGTYAKLIGNRKEEMTPAHRRIVHEYERLAGPVVSDTERKIPEIKEWFRLSEAKRTLPFYAGRLEVQVLRNKFSISRNQLAGCQPLLDAIDALNKELASRGYKPKDQFDLEVALLKALPKAKLHKSGLSFDRRDLAGKLRCPEANLSRSPYREHIKAAEAAHRERVDRDPTWVRFPERAIDYSPLIAIGWSEHVVQRICTAFRENFVAQLPERRMRIGIAIFKFFKRLARLSVRAVRVAFNSINNRTEIADQEWRMALDEIGRGLGGNACGYFNTVIACFGSEGILPRTTHRLKPPPQRSTSNSRRTVAEAALKPAEVMLPPEAAPARGEASADVMTTVKQYVSFAHWLLLQKSTWNEAGAEFRA